MLRVKGMMMMAPDAEEVRSVVETTIDIFVTFDDRLAWERGGSDGEWLITYESTAAEQRFQAGVVVSEITSAPDRMTMLIEVQEKSGRLPTWDTQKAQAFRGDFKASAVREQLGRTLASWYGELIHSLRNVRK